MKSINLNFMILVLLAISGFIAIDLYMPSFPSMVKYYHTSVNMIEFSLTIFLIGFTLSQLVFGILSDRFGRKSMILCGVVIYLVGSVIILSNANLTLLFLGRFLQGLGIGAAAVLSRTITRDLYIGTKLAQMFSLIAMSIILAPAIAPVLGGIIQHHIGYNGNFIFMLIYGILLLGITYYLLPETNTKKNPAATEIQYLKHKSREVLSHKQFMFSCITNGFSFSLIIVYSIVNPFILQTKFGYNAQQYGFLTLLIAGGLLMGMILNAFVVKRIQGKIIVGIGQGLIFSSALSLLISSHLEHSYVITLIATLFIMNIGIAFTLPNMAAQIFSFFDGSVGFTGAIYGASRMLTAAIIGGYVAVLHISCIENLSVLLVTLSSLAIITSILAHSQCKSTSI